MQKTTFNTLQKQLVWDFWSDCKSARESSFFDYAEPFVDANVQWHGPHPLNQQFGLQALNDAFCVPLMHAFPDIERHHDIFLAGHYRGNEWVCSTGYFRGTFTESWLGIPATGQPARLRFGEFCKIEHGKISAIYILFDLIDFIHQAGYRLLPQSPGSEDYIPGPKANDGIITAAQIDEETQHSLQLVEDMIFKGLMNFDGQHFESMDMSKFWHQDMVWYGPLGIGSSFGLDDYRQNHATPFLTAFPDRKGGDHVARLAEGQYIASTGWPSINATHMAPWLGADTTGKRITMRVMDFWKREGDTLTENWVFIDIIDVFLQFDIDLLQQFKQQLHG